MRILYSHRINSNDGQGVHVGELVRALREQGHDVLVVGPGFYDADAFGGESALVARLRRLLPGVLGELAEVAYNVHAYRRLEAAWRAFRPDVVYERCNLYFLAGALLARRHGVPLLLEVNSPLAEERARDGGLRLPWLARALERWTWRGASRVLPVTRVLADVVAAAGVPESRLRVVPNGVDLSRFPPPAPPHGGVVTLGFVGFVREWHGLGKVIEGMCARAPDARLVVVGDGPALPGLVDLANRLDVADRVRFAGLVPPGDVAALVAGFDVALQPAASAYASPLKVFDYMAAGCAICAPDQPNIREVLRDGETALLFAPGEMWAKVAVLTADPALRARLGAAARAALVARDHTWAGNARRVTAIAGEVVISKG